MMAEQGLRDCLHAGDKPLLLSWGVHEGIRGATWIQLHADGRLVEQRYLPNTAGEVMTRELGCLPPERFDELLELVLGIPDEYAAEGGVDPAHLITVACFCDRSRWEWSAPPVAVARDGPLGMLAHAFSGLADELPENSPDGQAE